MSSNTRSVGLNITRRINEIYSAVAPIKAAADAWTLTGDDNLLPTDAAMRAAIEAFEVLEITPLRLFEEIQEIKTGATPPLISGQVIIGWESIVSNPGVVPALPSKIKIGNLWLRRGEIEGAIDWSDDNENWQYWFPPKNHSHVLRDLDGQQEMEVQITGNQFATQISLFPNSVTATMASWSMFWAVCNGAAISRDTPGGNLLVAGGCQFGVGDGVSTVNLPDMTPLAPAGHNYMMFIGASA